MVVKLYILCLIFIPTVTGIMDYCDGHFANCICTDTYVECHNEVKINNDISKLFHYIQENVSSITITGSNLKELPQNTFGSCRLDTSLVLHQLKTVDLSNNNISIIHGKSLHCVPNLESLDLSNNAWEVDRNPDTIGYFTSLPKLKHLDLTNAFAEVWDGNIRIKQTKVFRDTDMAALETLKLGNNEFHSFDVSATIPFCQFTSLRHLDISHNALQYPSLPDNPSCLDALKILDLSYNHIQVMPKEFMDKLEHLHNLEEVKLDNNPFKCDCGLTETWKWLNATKVPVNKPDLKCAAGRYHWTYENEPVLSVPLSELVCEDQEPMFNSAGEAVAAMSLQILFTIRIIFAHMISI